MMKNLTERKLVYLDDAIDAVNSLCDDCDSGYCGDCRVNIYLGGGVRKVLEALPSAQPERLTGNWIGVDDEPCDVYECDRCGTTYDTVDCTWDLPNFCPNCGARMVQEGEDNDS